MQYSYRKIEGVREDVIGLEVVDFIDDGDIIFLKDKEGRSYTIDNTGENGAVVHKGTTIQEDVEIKLTLFDLLLEKLGIDESELWDLCE